MRLAFATEPLHADAIDDGYRIVAFDPHAQVTLERAGREFGRPEDYTDPAEIERRGLENFAVVDRLCDRLDALAALHVPAAAARGLRPARWQYMELKPVYDLLSLRAFELRRILEREHPEEVLGFAGEYEGALLEVLAPALGIAASTRPAMAKPAVPTATPPPLATRIARRLRRSRTPPGDLRILCAFPAYSVPAIARELRALGHAAVDWPRPPRAPAGPNLDALHIAIERDGEVRGAFVWEELDYWQAARPLLRRVLDEAVRESVRADAEAVAAFAAVRPHAILTAVAALPREKAICAAAARAGIPTLVARHGELGMRASPMVERQDVDSADWSLCWGAWEEAWTARHAHRPVETVVVGAPMIEEAAAHAPTRAEIRLQLAIAGDERIAIYVPTNLSERGWYAGRRLPPDSVYFRQQQDVVRALTSLDGWRVLVKEHPAHRPTPLERWCEGLPGVELIYEPAFGALINLADVVVLDAPSTSLVQAMFGAAPIYVIDDPLFAWEPGVVEHLTSHGIVFSRPERLAGDLRVGAARGSFTQEARDPLAFGGDGQSAKRAARAIVDIVRG